MKRRLIFDSILNQKNSKKISIILGPRQAGKTTILEELYKKLGGVFLDIDIFSNYEKISAYEKFINFIQLKGYKKDQKSFFYVFLDEFQRYADLTIIMKNIYDHHSNIKIYASGSSSLLIKNAIQESLAGRKQITHLYPLSFKEFLIFRERNDLLEEIENLKKIKTGNYSKLTPEVFKYLNEFMVFGGYPEVALSKTREEKIEALRNIFDLYIKKDLVNFLKPAIIDSAHTLIKQLAINNGMIANYSNYGMRVGIDAKTVKNYIRILRETFLIIKLVPYFTNKNKEIAKIPKIYFLDNGVRNYFFNNFNDPEMRNDAGILFEGFYISEIIKSGEDADNIKYYRTKIGSEVDVILDRVSEIIPIEIKYKRKLKESDARGLKKFMKEYKIPTGYLVNAGEINKEQDIKKIDCFNLR